MVDQTLPELSGSETNRQERIDRFRQHIESQTEGVQPLDGGSSNPVIHGIQGMFTNKVAKELTKVGDNLPEDFTTTERNEDGSMTMRVTGEIDVNINGAEVSKMVEPQPTLAPAESEQQDETITPGRLEKLLDKGSEKTKNAGNAAAGGAAMFFGSDPIVAGAMATLSKLGSMGGSKLLSGGAGLVRKRREGKKGPRKEAREKMIENRKTKSIRKRTAVQDADITAHAATAAIEKMDPDSGGDSIVGEKVTDIQTGTDTIVEKVAHLDALSDMKDSVLKIESSLSDGLPTAQEKAVEKLNQRKDLENQEDTKKTLEEISDNTAQKEESGGILGSLMDTLGGFGLGRLGLAGAGGGIIGSIMTTLTTALPRLLWTALKKFPLIGFVTSAVKGLFDGIKHYMEGGTIMGAIFETIEGFADSLIRIFTFGLVNLEDLRNWMQPAFDVLFDGVSWLVDKIMAGVDMITSSISWVFEKVKSVFEYIGEFISSLPELIVGQLPDFMQGTARSVLGIGEEGEEAATNRTERLKTMERESIERTLERGTERKGPAGDEVELSPERREQLENKLETLNKTETVERVNPVEEEIRQGRIEESRNKETVQEHREMMPGREIEKERLDREQMADSFANDSIELDLAPLKSQAQQSKAISNRINNIVQHNNNQSNIINPPGSLRKEDYFSGVSNREVDW